MRSFLASVRLRAIVLLAGWLGLAPLPAAHAQCTLSASSSAGQPLAVCAGGSLTLTAQATVAGFPIQSGANSGIIRLHPPKK